MKEEIFQRIVKEMKALIRQETEEKDNSQDMEAMEEHEEVSADPFAELCDTTQADQEDDLEEDIKKELLAWKRSKEATLKKSHFPAKYRDQWVSLFIKYNTGIPSSAAVERLFSTAGDVLRPKRACLSEDNFEYLVFLKGNLHLLKQKFKLHRFDVSGSRADWWARRGGRRPIPGRAGAVPVLGPVRERGWCQASQDHLLLSNRSHVMHTMGQAEEALRDAEAATRCRPEWAKGYFRRAMALTSLGSFEDSVGALLQCAILEEANSMHNIKDEITKAFHRILVRLSCNRRYSIEARSSRHLHCYSRLADPPLIPVPDSGTSDSEDSEDGRKQSHCGAAAHPVEEVSLLRKIMDKFNHEIERNKKSSAGYVREADPLNYDKNDFECTLCYRHLHEPVTTPCGHSFCRSCLDRCLDHSTSCPLCKTSIKMFLAERRTSVTEFIDTAMHTVMPRECRERQRQHDEELDELAAAGKDSQHSIPIFIATLALPTISCPLHVFEPRYRLMIRRCMESGTREFGMCIPMDTAENGYADSGTMLEIRDVEYTADGRSIVNTVGSRRFRIVRKSVKDGYNTAAVEFLQDISVTSSNLAELHKLHDCVHSLASQWFESIEHLTKRRILVHFGPMPALEGEYWTIPNGPAWMWWVIAILPLDHRIQASSFLLSLDGFHLSILSETSLKRRLEILRKIVRCVLAQQRPPPAPPGAATQ
ncbi:LON peptidase N-terminal domain and RING finger protein 3 [Chionoecetes opilio]|nr:LON peptidase N-terminal domain and RING finger protein 3 [Chionoecetes opilio]